MKILITGSSGYVGNFLTEYFSAKGITILGLDVALHPRQKNLKGFTFFKCDVRDGVRLKQIMNDSRPTHIIHLAYLMDPSHSKRFEYEIDVLGSKNVFEAANSVESIKQFINFSSTSAYGARPDNPDWIGEETLLQPEDYVYGINKKIIEDWVAAFPKRSDLKVVTLRMCTAVGPSYYKPGGIVSSFSKAPFAVSLSKAPTKVQFIHEDDVKALTEKIVNDHDVEVIFNLVPDSFVTIQELAASQKKRLIYIPRFIFHSIISLLWNLHLVSISPPMVRLMAFSIVASPKKIMERYQCRFKYSTLEAFVDAVNKRRSSGNL